MNLHEVLFASKMTGNSEIDFSEYVKKTDYATKEKTGIMRPGGGLDVRSSGTVEVASASSAEISAGTNNYKPIVPANLASAMSAYGINSKTQIDEMLSTLAGETVTGKTYDVNNIQYTSGDGAEIFNDYENNLAVGDYSHAEGYKTFASDYSHAEGSETTASGKYSHAEGGSYTRAEGITSHAEGSGSIASRVCSHAEGGGTRATGNDSHAEGQASKSNGYCSHAEGQSSQADGSYSHSEGQGTIVTSNGSHAGGLWNVEDKEKNLLLL